MDNEVPVYRAVTNNATVGVDAHIDPAVCSTDSPKANANTQHLAARADVGIGPYKVFS